MALLFVLATLLPLERAIGRLAPSGSFRVPYVGLTVGAGLLATLAKALAAGAAFRGLQASG